MRFQSLVPMLQTLDMGRTRQWYESILGFHCRTTVRAGIQKLLDHLREQPEGLAALAAHVEDVNWVAPPE